MGAGMLSWRERGRLWLRLGIRAALAAAVILLLVFVVAPVFSLMMPFVLALLLAWVLNPPVKWLKERLPASRRTISLLVLLLTLVAAGGICFGLGWALLDQVRSLLENWTGIVNGVFATIDAVEHWLGRLGEILPEGIVSTETGLFDALTGWLRGLDFSSPIKDMAGHTADFVSAVPGFVVAFIIFLMASYFITSDYPRLRYMLTEQFPVPLRRFGSQVRTIFSEAFGGYIKSQIILSLGVFAILAIGFVATGQPYGLLLALGLAVMDFIPLIGAGTVMVPWAVIDLITAKFTQSISLMVIWGIIVLYRRVAEPKILGDQTGLSPILSLAGIYAGMRVGGVLGMVLGPVLLLVLINLGKTGIFHPLMNDIRLCAGDVFAIMKSGAPPRGGEDGGDGPAAS